MSAGFQVSFNRMVKSESIQLDLLFHALADSTRRAILKAVAKKEKTVSEIAKPFRISFAAVSKHLKVLEAANLIKRRKAGSFQMVALNAQGLLSAEQWIAYYRQFGGDRLDALQALMEEEKR
jgi:DNA-binding transcriptional ArsR family regulator